MDDVLSAWLLIGVFVTGLNSTGCRKTPVGSTPRCSSDSVQLPGIVSTFAFFNVIKRLRVTSLGAGNGVLVSTVADDFEVGTSTKSYCESWQYAHNGLNIVILYSDRQLHGIEESEHTIQQMYNYTINFFLKSYFNSLWNTSLLLEINLNR